MKITIPFKPRDYQLPLINAIDSGGAKRAVAVWHRRAGKDVTLWNLIIKKAVQNVGLYYYLLPTYAQAKKIIWDGINNDGFRFIDYCPLEICEQRNISEQKLELKNGSIIQLVGTDNYDAIRGTNPIGCVFSEFAFQNPMAWEVVKPILKVNGGWAVFNSTPNGKNHFFDLYHMARENDDWFSEILNIYQTKVLTIEDIEEEKREGMSDEMIQQEYYCSFDIGALGSYYATYVKDATDSNRVCVIPIEKARPVDLWLDLGRNDSTTVIFTQQIGKEIRVVDCYEKNGEDVGHYCQYLRSLGYEYGVMGLPHDGFNKRLESNKTIAEQFKEAGFKIIRVPNHHIQHGIQEVRKIFPRVWFDKEKTKELLRALENYHKDYDEKAKVFRKAPKHDWSSHFADAFRYMAIGIKEELPDTYEQDAKQLIDFVSDDPLKRIRGDGFMSPDEYKDIQQYNNAVTPLLD